MGFRRCRHHENQLLVPTPLVKPRQEFIEGQPPRCQAMTGLRADQVAELVTVVFALMGGAWQPVRGRRRMLGLFRAVVLTLF
jgi:hypothetical protein